MRIYLLILTTTIFMNGVAYSEITAKASTVKGIDYASQGNFKKAKIEFLKALKIDHSYNVATNALKMVENVNKKTIKKESAIHLFKASSLAYKGKVKLAIKESTKSIEIDPKNYFSYVMRGKIYKEAAIYDKAIHDFTKAIDINPKLKTAYSNRAISYQKSGRVDLAIGDYSKEIELDPKNAQAYSNRGVAYFVKLNKKTKGCADFYKGCELGSCDNYIVARDRGGCKNISKNRSKTTKVPCKVILAEWTKNGSIIAPEGCSMRIQIDKATPYCNGIALTNDSCSPL